MSAQKKTIGELLGATFRMLDSVHEKEALAAIAAMKRLIASRGLTLSDIAILIENWGGEEIEAKKYSDTDAEIIFTKGVEKGRAEEAHKQQAPSEFFDADGQPHWYEIAVFCQQNSAQLRDQWDRNFIENMPEKMIRWGAPTEKQRPILLGIFVKLGGRIPPKSASR